MSISSSATCSISPYRISPYLSHDFTYPSASQLRQIVRYESLSFGLMGGWLFIDKHIFVVMARNAVD